MLDIPIPIAAAEATIDQALREGRSLTDGEAEWARNAFIHALEDALEAEELVLL